MRALVLALLVVGCDPRAVLCRLDGGYVQTTRACEDVRLVAGLRDRKCSRPRFSHCCCWRRR